MELDYGWLHARKRWSWDFEDFEKESFESLGWSIEARVGYSAIGSWILIVESRSWDFRISTDRDLKYHKMRRTWGGVESA